MLWHTFPLHSPTIKPHRANQKAILELHYFCHTLFFKVLERRLVDARGSPDCMFPWNWTGTHKIKRKMHAQKINQRCSYSEFSLYLQQKHNQSCHANFEVHLYLLAWGHFLWQFLVKWWHNCRIKANQNLNEMTVNGVSDFLFPWFLIVPHFMTESPVSQKGGWEQCCYLLLCCVFRELALIIS